MFRGRFFGVSARLWLLGLANRIIVEAQRWLGGKPSDPPSRLRDQKCCPFWVDLRSILVFSADSCVFSRMGGGLITRRWSYQVSFHGGGELVIIPFPLGMVQTALHGCYRPAPGREALHGHID